MAHEIPRPRPPDEIDCHLPIPTKGDAAAIVRTARCLSPGLYPPVGVRWQIRPGEFSRG
jgi:hypothetical protein